ncbi:ANTAR domain-containing protein [Streptomyces sp. NPDC005551]|uniref:ANTAR domain-containing protein n=1 Tax=Streptomyces sp. NPDC005551 TaxID=3364725 RepID=UPI003692E4BE
MEHAETAPEVWVEKLPVQAGSGRSAWLIRPVGTVDRAGHPLFEAIRTAGERAGTAVVVDLSHVRALSAGAVRELLDCAHTLEAARGRLLLAGPAQDVDPLLRLALGLAPVPVFATLGAAVHACASRVPADATGVPGGGTAADRGGRTAARHDELAQLQQAVSSHAVVDQAIGIVVALAGLRTEDAWHVVREISQHTNIKMRHVAELIVEWAQTGHLASDIRHHLQRSLAARRPALPEAG